MVITHMGVLKAVNKERRNCPAGFDLVAWNTRA